MGFRCSTGLSAGGTLAREKDVCQSILPTLGAKMIILDEVNGMLAGTFRQQRIFLNAIRFLANDLRIPLVCAGTDLARQALLTDAQLAERFEAFHLKPWQSDAGFSGLLKSFERILPLREPSDPMNQETRDRIHKLTSGVTARIFRLIETARRRRKRAPQPAVADGIAAVAGCTAPVRPRRQGRWSARGKGQGARGKGQGARGKGKNPIDRAAGRVHGLSKSPVHPLNGNFLDERGDSGRIHP